MQHSFVSARLLARMRRPRSGERMIRLLKNVVLSGVVLIAMGLAGSARAAEPTEIVREFYATLLEVMKQAEKLGLKGRADKLAPAIDKAYDLPLMARLRVGPKWQSLSPDDQQKIAAGFRQMTIATYASRFDG